MAKIYVHKLHGLQLRFTIYFPEGKVVRYRFSRSRDEMYSLHRAAEMLEVASRRCDASFREVEVAVNLGVDPLLLFVVKAGLPVKYLDHPTRMSLFDVRDVPNMRFGEYIRGMRHALELTLAEVNALAKLDPARYGMSPGYLVQVETYADEFVKNVSGEKLWALGCLYRVDPLALFCLSRGMTSLLDSKTRNSLFGKFSL
jgi:hypothetical protein